MIKARAMLLLVLILGGAMSVWAPTAPNLVAEGSFEGGEVAAKAAGWLSGAHTELGTGVGGAGTHFVRCGCGDPVVLACPNGGTTS